MVVRLKSAASTPVTGSEKVTLNFTLKAEVGLALARLMLLTVGGKLSTSTTSKAPMSQALPWGRVTPR